MPSINWQNAAAIATVLSSALLAASAIAVVVQLRQAARSSYFSVTAHLFEIWQSNEFQHDQLFLLHKLETMTWEDFCATGRGEHAERAIHRVGGFYDRVGNLVRHNLIRQEEILPTIGGYAVAVWHRIEPLVKEMRLRENAVLFENYEALLPECHECYVPGVAHIGRSVRGAQLQPPICDLPTRVGAAQPPTESVLAPPLDPPPADGKVHSKFPVIVVPATAPSEPLADFMLPDSDGVTRRLSEFVSSGPTVLVYIRGAWCAFCLRQLADYAERYQEFKRTGVEIVALNPESQRRSRRLRKGLKLPFTVLSDAKHEAARHFGLIDREKPGQPTAATLVLDTGSRVRLSSLNDWARSLAPRDAFEFARAIKLGEAPAEAPSELELPKPRTLFLRGFANMALGLVRG